jgi:hypothetical protein
MITEEESQEDISKYNMRLIMTQMMNRPNPMGPRRDRRRKSGGKMGVTRRASSRRLSTQEVIEHVARETDAVKRGRFAEERPWEQLALTFADRYLKSEVEYGWADSWNSDAASQYINLVVGAYRLGHLGVYVRWSFEDQAFLATSKTLSLTAHGGTIEEAVRELKKAVGPTEEAL